MQYSNTACLELKTQVKLLIVDKEQLQLKGRVGEIKLKQKEPRFAPQSGQNIY